MMQWVLVVLVAMIGCGDDQPAGTCDDGVRNGGETGVDCGGGCYVSCAIGGGCKVDADCMFARCADSTCAAPDDGPDPTGPVSATIGPAGTTIDFVSDERVAFHLVVPPGAIDPPINVAIGGTTPGYGEWLAAKVEPGGMIFRVPATLTVTLPPGVDPKEGFLGASEVDAATRYACVASDDADARTIVSTVSFLGDPTSHPNPPLIARTTAVPHDAAQDARHWEIFIQRALLLPPATFIPMFQQLADELNSIGRESDAAMMVALIRALRARQSDGATQARLDAFFAQQRSVNCMRLTSQLTTLDESNPACGWKVRSVAVPVLLSEAILEALGTESNGFSCPNTSDWHDRIGAKLESTIVKIRGDRQAWVRCECSRPVRPGETKPLWCANVPPDTAAPNPPVETYEWQLFAAAVAGDRLAFDVMYAVGLGALAPPLANALSDGEIEVVRKLAYDTCLSTQDMSYLQALAKIVPEDKRAAILDDAQHCASTVTIASVDSGGVTHSTSAAAPGATPGSTSIDINAVTSQGHTLQIRGPLSTLQCRTKLADASTREADVLTLYAQKGNIKNPLGTLQANGAATVLSTTLGFNVDVDVTRTALAIANDAPFDLVLERSGPGCGIHATSVIYRIHVGPDRKLVFARFTGTRSDLFVVNADGSGEVDLTAGAALSDSNPAWSADHQRIVFTRGNDIYIMNADGTAVTPVTTGFVARNPSWSPDGTRIVFQSIAATGPSLRMINADGTNLVPFAGTGQPDDKYPAWSPDGTRIAFEGYPPAPAVYDLFVASSNGTGLLNLTKDPNGLPSPERPSWSPNSTKIAFDRGGRIWVMNADGTVPTQLTVGPGDTDPTWSPDGTQIAFAHSDANGSTVYVINIDGTNARPVATGFQPAW